MIRVDIAEHQGFDSGDGVAFGSLRLQRAHELRQPWRAYPGRHPMQDLEYGWDGYGNLMKRTDFNRSLGETFQYDDLNRLKDSTVTNPANNGPTISNINYDSVGNIQNRTLSGTVETYSYDPNHPYAVNGVTDTSGTIYSASYDADGDMTNRNGYQIQWTVDNLPESIASAQGTSTFSYDPEGNRYYQSATFNGATTDTTYIGGLFEVVSNTTTTEYRHNIIADGQIVAVHTIDQSGNAHTSYLNYDHLGSVDAITDDSGAVIQTMSFDAYGLRRDPGNWDYDLSQNTIATLKDYTDRGYTDQEQLDNVALVDLNGRVYDPTVGRMISADPTIPDPLFSQSFNRYSYVFNSPLENTDPSGFGPAPGPCNPGGTQKHQDGSGSSSCVPETGSHIPGVNTGASCSGNCQGWTDFGPGQNGPGNGNEGSGPCEGGPGNCALSGDPQNDNQNQNANTLQLGEIHVTGIRLTPPPQQPYFTANPFNDIWSYFLFSYSSPSAFLEATPKGYSRLAIRGLEIGHTGKNLPILSIQEEELILEEIMSVSNPIASLFSQNINLPSDDNLLHTDIFSVNQNGSINVSGYFDGPDNGRVGPDSESGNISTFLFGPPIPTSQLNLNPEGFGPGTYNFVSHNCQDYASICLLGPGG